MDEPSSPLASQRDLILEQRARNLSYETIAELLAERGVQSSPTAVGRFCRKYLLEEEVARRRTELKGKHPSEALSGHRAPTHVIEMDALLEAAKLEFQSLLDARLNGVSAAAASIEKSREQLAELKTVIHERPTVVAKLFEAELQGSAVKVVTRVKELETTLGALLVATNRTLERTERRLLLAVWVLGVGVGALGCWLAVAQ